MRHRHELMFRLFFFVMGFVPISALAVMILGWAPLNLTTPLFVFPLLVTALVVALQYPRFGRLAVQGWCAGVIATLLYDSTRLPFLWLGLWQDFIPKIGDFLLNAQGTPWVVGYLWRYLGNGGGMGVAFVMVAPWLAKSLGLKIGAVVYGLAIWVCLMLTLLGSPDPAGLLFALTPLSFVLSLVGHLVYGALLGLQLDRSPSNASKSALRRGTSSLRRNGDKRDVPAALSGEM